ncbi:TPA: hypothetical protein DDY55_03735 [Candidatus Falkowbacteria bacterium]|nr:hypothetical protein [Candidatus Falkowbacteria bacterium]HBI97205.1 hypothetical protein [Candidatus Falkowbacteria bacterium]
MALATTQGKEHALEQLRQRKEKNRGKEKVNNASLWAGSDMFYYCQSCDEEMRLPETHPGPAPRLCNKCSALKNEGWLE